MKQASNINFGTRVASNLMFVLAIIILCTFGVGGDDWSTGFWVSIPVFLYSLWLTFKANHTVNIRDR